MCASAGPPAPRHRRPSGFGGSGPQSLPQQDEGVEDAVRIVAVEVEPLDGYPWAISGTPASASIVKRPAIGPARAVRFVVRINR